MNSRQSNIIYNLASSKVPLTSQQLAECLDVSTRTIKTEMKEIRKILESVGASLIAKRNEGYSIQVDNPESFLPFVHQLENNASLNNYSCVDYMPSFLYIARKLIDFSKYVKLDDIADELHSSRSTLRIPIRITTDFLSSYKMVTESTPGLGMRAYGLEYYARMAMVELFSDSIGKAESSKWTADHEKEQKEIQDTLLFSLLSSGIKIRNCEFERICTYLILAKNRYAAGYRIILPNTWINEIKQYKEYAVSEDVFSSLSKNYMGLDMPDQEVSFLAILLLCSRDMGNVRASNEDFPSLYIPAEEYSLNLVKYLNEQLNIGISKKLTEDFKSTLIVILARAHFGLSGTRTIASFYKNKKQEDGSPVVTGIVSTMLKYLERKLGNDIVDSVNFHLLSNIIDKMLSTESYDIKKMKLLFVSLEDIDSESWLVERIETHFAKFIDFSARMSAYELPGLQEEFDARIILNASNDHCDNYQMISGKAFCAAPDKSAIIQIYNNVLIRAYQIPQIISNQAIYTYRDISFPTKEQFLKQFDNPSQKMQIYCVGKSAFLLQRANSAGNERMNIYQLREPGLWDKNEIQYILYARLTGKKDVKWVKALNDFINQLAADPDSYRLFDGKTMDPCETIIRKALEI